MGQFGLPALPVRSRGTWATPFGVTMYTEEMRSKELSDGHMAAISVLGIFAAELAAGKRCAIGHYGLPALPVRRCGKEMSDGRMAAISVMGFFAAEMAAGGDAVGQVGIPVLPVRSRRGLATPLSA